MTIDDKLSLDGSAFSNPDFAARWADAVGSTGHPDGDSDREKIINPAILFVLRRFERWARDLRSDYPRHIDPAVLATIKMTDPSLTVADAYTSILPVDRSRTLTVVDLGCGEGYLGRRLVLHRKLQYRGVDLSGPLIGEAKDRATAPAEMTFYEEDLNSPTTDCAANFVFLILVLEHLRAPEAILRHLATSATPRTICVAVTLNGQAPRISEGHPSAFPGGAAVPWSVPLPWPQGRSPVTIRSEHEYQRLLRDAGHLIHEVAALPDPSDPNKPSPFTLWVFSPMGVPASKKAQAPFHGTPMAKLASDKLQALTESIATIRVEPNHPIVTPSMLGGRLFIVGRGEAIAHTDAEPKTAKITFPRGQLFGDLEAGWGFSWDEHYQLRVRAGKEGCDLVVVPEPVARSLVKDELDFGLFRMLQGRLRERLWLDRIDKGSIGHGRGSAITMMAAGDGDKAFHDWYLQDKLVVEAGALVGLARKLMLAVHSEQTMPHLDGQPGWQVPRSPDGMAVYLRMRSPGSDAVRALVALGISATIIQKFKVSDGPLQGPADQLAQLLGLPPVAATLKTLSAFRKEDKESVRGAVGKDNAGTPWLIRALELLTSEGEASFFVIDDFPALRQLAFSRGLTTRQILLARGNLLRSNLSTSTAGSTPKDIGALDHHGSLQNRWLTSFVRFVAADYARRSVVLAPSLSVT